MTKVSGTTTNADAMPLYILLKKKLSADQTVVLSFRNSTPLSSSFLNSSIGRLIDEFGFDYFKSHVKIVHCSKSIVGRLKYYFDGVKQLNH